MKLEYSPHQLTSHIYAGLDDRLVIGSFDGTIENSCSGVIVS